MHVDMKDFLMVLGAWPHHSGMGAMLDPPWRGLLQFAWGSRVDSHSPCPWARAFLRTCVVFTELIPPTPALFYFQYHLLVFKAPWVLWAITTILPSWFLSCLFLWEYKSVSETVGYTKSLALLLWTVVEQYVNQRGAELQWSFELCLIHSSTSPKLE